MQSMLRGLMAAVLLSVLGAGTASAATVTVRVEGASRTLVQTVQVSTFAGAFSKTGDPSQTCSGASAGGALEVATHGDWGGHYDSSYGQAVDTIAGETHTFDSGRYWAFYVNDRSQSQGACATTVQDGDEVLFYDACAGASTDCFAGEPLDLRAPATVRPGEAFTATVQEVTTTYGGAPDYATSSAKAPSAGATVAGAGQSATTDAAGRATFAFAQRGPVTLTATKGDRVRESVVVCVTDGADGYCGTAAPGQAASQQGTSTASGCATDGRDGRCGTRDREAPHAFIESIRSGHRYRHGRGPRTLAGIVAPSPKVATAAGDPSGLLMVKLRLTRSAGGRCSTYSGSRERFVAARCGARNGSWFRIGDRAAWSYLLPSALPPGRYVLDANVVDKAYNRDDRRSRGQNRVVFVVR